MDLNFVPRHSLVAWLVLPLIGNWNLNFDQGTVVDLVRPSTSRLKDINFAQNTRELVGSSFHP